MRTLMLLVALASAFGAHAELDSQQQARYQSLIAELRCLVCQNQSIADSNAPLAGDLRDQVSAQIAAGKSDRQIMDYVTARYGDFVLYRPPVQSNTMLLWIAPGLLLLGGAVIAWRIARRRTVAAPAKVDEKKLQQLLKQTEERKP